jgi:hypothetical protein
VLRLSLVLALAVAGCEVIVDEAVEDSPPPGLADLDAPADTDFSTVRQVAVEIDVPPLRQGARSYLRIVEPRIGQLYLGLLKTQGRMRIELSVPRASEALEYEIYDSQGGSHAGVVSLD